MILHELGQQFNSPTVNLFFRADDYIKFLQNLQFYLKQELVEIQSEKNYPVAKLNDIIIYFMNYSNFAEAKATWEKRVRKIVWGNMFFIMVQQSGCTKGILKQFDELPYEHKVALVSSPMADIKCSYYIENSELPNEEVMDLCLYKNKLSGRRWIDDFDYVAFLNEREKVE